MSGFAEEWELDARVVVGRPAPEDEPESVATATSSLREELLEACETGNYFKVQDLLQCGRGSEDEWENALSHDDFRIVQLLLAPFSNEGSSEEEFLAASRCLAFSGNVYRRLWVDFVCDEEQHLDLVCKAAVFASQQCIAALRETVAWNANKPPEECTTYLGFDKRDIKDFNLVGYDEDDDSSRPNSTHTRRSSTHGVVGMEDVDDFEVAVSVWLLLLFQMFCEKSSFLSAVLRRYYHHLEAEGSDADDPHRAGDDDQDREEDHLDAIPPSACAARTFDAFVTVTEALLGGCKHFTAKAYLDAVKALAALNRHCPRCISEDGTTLVSKRCGLYFGGRALGCRSGSDSGTGPGVGSEGSPVSPSSAANSSVVEGVMHLLNDSGFPWHTTPEAAAALQMCTDLLSYVSESNVFYLNDVKVLCDIVCRELVNISPPSCSSSSTTSSGSSSSSGSSKNGGTNSNSSTASSADEEARVRYLALLNAIVSYFARKQLSPEDMPKAQELLAAVRAVAGAEGEAFAWSREEATDVLLGLEAFLDCSEH